MPGIPEIVRESTVLTLPIWLELLGVVSGSISGALVARARRLDLVGACTLGMLCGLGGGLVRDIIMQVGSVYMLDSPYAIPVSLVASVVVFLFPTPVSHLSSAIEWVDIVSVGLFCAAGCDKALLYGLSPMSCILMGVLTGVGGGMVRDVFLGEVPKIFIPGNLYAICALGGSALYVAMYYAGILNPWDAVACVGATMLLRRLSLRFNLRTPADMELTEKVVEPVRRVVLVSRRSDIASRTAGRERRRVAARAAWRHMVTRERDDG